MHDHRHDHEDHARREPLALGRLSAAVALTFGFAAVEAIGGFWTGSLALLADALHMVTDGASLLLALGAVVIGRRPHSARATFGYHRAEVLAALINAAVLGVLVLRIGWEACVRLVYPATVAGSAMTLIAGIGLIVNLIVLLLLQRGTDRHSTLNERAAAAHVLGDLLGSILAIGAGVAVSRFGWVSADPLASIAVSGLVGWSALRILREASWVLLEGVPDGVDTERLTERLGAVEGVLGVDDLHVWSLVPGRVALSAHLRVARDVDPARYPVIVAQAASLLRDEFEIVHSTLQIDATYAAPRLPALR